MLIANLEKVEKEYKHIWPEGHEIFDAIFFTLNDGKKTIPVIIGFTMRRVFGKNRRRIVVFVKRYPQVEFIGTDEFDRTGELVGVIKRPKSGKHYLYEEDLPIEYFGFNLVRYKDYINKRGAYNSVAIIVNVSDLSTMLRHAFIQAKWQGLIG